MMLRNECPLEDGTETTYSVLDLFNSDIVAMISNPSSLIFENIPARYNGLLWRDEQNQSALLPYFVKLASRTWYHNSTTRTTPRQAQDGNRVVKAATLDGLSTEDVMAKIWRLSIWLRARLSTSSLWGAGERMVLFPGFSDGRLGVWGYNEKTQRRYSRYLDRLMAMNLDQEEYDVNGVRVAE